jgi:putative Holliday junction resolvase
MAELCAIIEREQPELVVVGLPLTLRAEHGSQADETAAFVARLRERCPVPIQTEDERFTTTIARQARTSSRTPDDPLAAAVLLQGVLDRRAAGGGEP